MTGARLLVWLIAAVALLAPPAMTVHAMAPVAQAASIDCADHAPPPNPCPDHGTAKHATGACCPLMSGAVALLPATVANGAAASSHALPNVRLPSLIGRIVTQDPPPPRA
jgi:hypothetical protein